MSPCCSNGDELGPELRSAHAEPVEAAKQDRLEHVLRHAERRGGRDHRGLVVAGDADGELGLSEASVSPRNPVKRTSMAAVVSSPPGPTSERAPSSRC